MRFKVTVPKECGHEGPVTCVEWSNSEEVYSVGDDHKLLSWRVSTGESTKVVDFPPSLFPTDLHFLTRTNGAAEKQSDLIVLSSAEGKFYILNRIGRIERSVEAHKGAILTGQWSNDGAGLLTAGEDGVIKIWSRSGMLRSTVVASESSVYATTWSPDSQSIVYTQGNFLIIKHLAPNTKPIRWRAHDGLILSVAWSLSKNQIVSGAEDCRYKVWDAQGRQLFTSTVHDHPITSIAWSPNGDVFVVASYNTLRLCDASGWSRSLDKPTMGCIYKMAWSNDGTQLAGACANGRIFFAHLIGRSVHYANYIATIADRKTINVRNILDDSVEMLEFPERIIQLVMKYTHLVITTPTQCYIYSSQNWNTPIIFDLKHAYTTLLLLCEKHMLLGERTSMGIYNYQGRLIASPRWPNMRLDNLTANMVSLSSDILAVVDADLKTIHLLELDRKTNDEQSLKTVKHHTQIVKIALDQHGATKSRNLAALDRNRNLHVVCVGSPNCTFAKLANQVDSFEWNGEENILAAIQDTHLVIWYCPSACFNVKLLKLSSQTLDASDLGRNPKILNFTGSTVLVRRSDGSTISVLISPFPALLHRHVLENKWSEALQLCRTTNDKILWTCVAVLATQSTDNELLETAEEAFAAINHYDKVAYIQHVRETAGGRAQQIAGIALLGGSMQNAELILIHNGLVHQAILNHVQLHNWNRALELAVKHKTNVETVLQLRQSYLKSLGKEENNNRFLAFIDNKVQ